jgi:hypothetical protein
MNNRYIYTSKSIEVNKEYFYLWLAEWKRQKIQFLNEMIEIAEEDNRIKEIPILISVRKIVRNLLPDLSNCKTIDDLLQIHEDVEKLVNVEMALTSTYEVK